MDPVTSPTLCHAKTHLEPRENNTPVPQCTITRKYINNTIHEVGLITRNNVLVKLSAAQYPTLNARVVVRTIYHFNNFTSIQSLIESNKIRLTRSNGGLDENDSSQAELRLVVKALEDHLVNLNYSTTTATIVLERPIDASEIEQKGSLYLPDEDVVLCKYDRSSYVNHPLSDKGRLMDYARAFSAGTDMSGVGIRLVDNTSTYSKRYIWLAGEIVAIPTTKDPDLHDGVYITRINQKPTLTKGNIAESDIVYMTTEEAQEKIGLYRTREEAMSGGNPEMVLKNVDAELRNEKARLEKEKLNAERSLEQIKRDNATAEQHHKTTELELKAVNLKMSQELEEAKRNAQILEQGYKTHEIELKNATLSSTRELEIIKRENTRLELENSRLRSEHERDAMARKETYETKKAVRDDHYESASHRRKDTSESIKVTGMVLAGVAALGAAAWKLKSMASSIVPAAASVASMVSRMASPITSSVSAIFSMF